MYKETSAVKNLAALSADFRKNMYPVVNPDNKNYTFGSTNNTTQVRVGEIATTTTNSLSGAPTTNSKSFFTNNYNNQVNNMSVNSYNNNNR